MDRLEALTHALQTEYGARRKQEDAAGGGKEDKLDPEARVMNDNYISRRRQLDFPIRSDPSAGQRQLEFPFRCGA
jgi:hypothetical protein